MTTSERITRDPAVRSGKPCIRGTRITVRDIVEYLAGGMSEDELLADFPMLTREDVQAVVKHNSAEASPRFDEEPRGHRS